MPITDPPVTGDEHFKLQSPRKLAELQQNATGVTAATARKPPPKTRSNSWRLGDTQQTASR
jgi:hypothetical protein